MALVWVSCRPGAAGGDLAPISKKDPMPDYTRGLQRAALTYALRDGWSASERRNLTDARELFKELLDAYYGKIDADLERYYGHEFAVAQEGCDE